MELLLAHSVGYVEVFYGSPHQSVVLGSLSTDARPALSPAMLLGGAKRLLRHRRGWRIWLYVEERVDADGGLGAGASVRLTDEVRLAAWLAPAVTVRGGPPCGFVGR